VADGVAPPERPFPHPPLPGILRYTGFYRHCTVGSLMADREKTLLSGRVKRIQQVLGRELRPGSSSGDPLPEKDRSYLLDTAQEFYWNDLEWEKLTGEEQLDEEFLTELAFPGFLAFVRGLLLEEAQPDSQAPPQPRPEVVADILGFLAGRVVELEADASSSGGEDRAHREAELQMTSRLVDLVLYVYYRLDPEEANMVEAVLSSWSA
jgi:hypothetical protein